MYIVTKTSTISVSVFSWQVSDAYNQLNVVLFEWMRILLFTCQTSEVKQTVIEGKMAKETSMNSAAFGPLSTSKLWQKIPNIYS